MKKYNSRICNLFALLLPCFIGFAAITPEAVYGQSSEGYKQMIQLLDQNNIDLEVLKRELEASQIENKTGLTPPNPRVGVNYLKPHPRLKDQRFDFNISQDFEFPSVYGYKRKLANEENQLTQLDFRSDRANLIQAALDVWSEWAYLRKKTELMKRQYAYTMRLLESVEKLLEHGEVSVLERNKVQVFALNFKKEIELSEIEAESAFRELLLYDQGQDIPFITAEYPVPFLDVITTSELADLENTNLEVQTLDRMLTVNQQEIKLRRSQNLPEWSIGFMREQDVEVDFRGVTLGMSIPLWQNKNQVKSAKVKQLALEHRRTGLVSSVHLELLRLSEKQASLLTYHKEIQEHTRDDRRLELIQKAYDLGEMSLSEYLLEQSLMIQLHEKLLEAELELSKIWIELHKGTW